MTGAVFRGFHPPAMDRDRRATAHARVAGKFAGFAGKGRIDPPQPIDNAER
jgi:hypothetical protein